MSAVAKDPHFSFIIIFFFIGPLLDWSGQTVLFSHWSKVSDVTPTTKTRSSQFVWSEFVVVAIAVEGMAIPGGDRQPSRAPTALKGMDLPVPGDPLRYTSSKRHIMVVMEVDQLRGPKRRDNPYI